MKGLSAAMYHRVEKNKSYSAMERLHGYKEIWKINALLLGRKQIEINIYNCIIYEGYQVTDIFSPSPNVYPTDELKIE